MRKSRFSQLKNEPANEDFLENSQNLTPKSIDLKSQESFFSEEGQRIVGVKSLFLIEDP